ncbi:hypothetical protein A0256_19295 [Mucilaginibacter sp. PAMC 26640]|nr:hypothetical protein A0256_19295 [Mucilaginibacter sp. PAMC 26640]
MYSGTIYKIDAAVRRGKNASIFSVGKASHFILYHRLIVMKESGEVCTKCLGNHLHISNL